jgi:two-component system NtrC family response regulator
MRTARCVELTRELRGELAAEAAPVNAALEGGPGRLDRFAAVLLDAETLAGEPDSLLRAVQVLSSDVPRLVALVDEQDVETGRICEKGGAWDLVPSNADVHEIADRLREAAALRRIERSVTAADDGAAPRAEGAGGLLVGQSERMKGVLALVRRLAVSDVPVLISGESGTGKEVAALAIHERSARARGPFVPIDCAAIPENLLESELFGHERGSFTGATDTRPGRIETAEGGTLFLDEIGELAPPLQVKLLRFLEDHRIRRVGGDRTVPLDVRVLAATHRDLTADVREGRFREDLYYRINVFCLDLPPLREREGDVIALARHFLEAEAGRSGRHLRGFTPEAIAALCRAEWPGNVRELENCVRRAVVVAEGDLVTPQDLGLAEPRAEYAGPTLHDARAQAEVEAVRAALVRADGNKSEAARLLDISRTQLYEIMHRYELADEWVDSPVRGSSESCDGER